MGAGQHKPYRVELKITSCNKEEVEHKEKYQKLVGRLIYLSHTCLNIVFFVSMIRKGILFEKHGHLHVEVYTDADWVGSTTDGRSTSGYCFFVEGDLVSW